MIDGLSTEYENAGTASGTTETYALYSGNNIAISGSVNAPVSAPTNEVVAGSVSAQYFQGSSGTQGIGFTRNYTARAAVSGGNLVVGSGNGQVVAAGAFSTPPAAVIGVATNATPVASGGTVSVLHYGVYPLIASATVASGYPVTQCSGTDAIISVSLSGSGTFGKALTAAASGGTVDVLLGPV